MQKAKRTSPLVVVGVVLGALVACGLAGLMGLGLYVKSQKPTPNAQAAAPAPATVPSEPETLGPRAVLDLAKNSRSSFEEQPLRVGGNVMNVHPGGTETPPTFDLYIGGRKIRAAMRPYSCLTGVCFKDPPPEGRTATLDCIGRFLLSTPFLAECDWVR